MSPSDAFTVRKEAHVRFRSFMGARSCALRATNSNGALDEASSHIIHLAGKCYPIVTSGTDGCCDSRSRGLRRLAISGDDRYIEGADSSQLIVQSQRIASGRGGKSPAFGEMQGF